MLLNTIKINGRYRYFLHIQSVIKTRHPGEYRVWSDRKDEPYYVEGGKKAGRARSDWFIEGPGLNRTIDCTSLIDALHLIDLGL